MGNESQGAVKNRRRRELDLSEPEDVDRCDTCQDTMSYYVQPLTGCLVLWCVNCDVETIVKSVRAA
jgi:hypothetical protein